jgi:tetratricopeptide (TPR) repeat protein
MLKKSLAVSPEEDRPNLLIQIAYNYINDQKYCEAIPSLKEYVEGAGSEDAENMMNLGAIYNRCDLVDSAYAVYQNIITFAPTHVDALVASGRYHNQQAIWAYDSVRHYDELKDEASSNKWKEHRVAEFGNAETFLGTAFENADASNAAVAGEYGLVLILVGDYEKAIVPFERLTELDPTDKNNWTTLGDCYLKMQNFGKSAEAYEHVVELDPDNRPVWESLAALYLELKMPEKREEAKSHIN